MLVDGYVRVSQTRSRDSESFISPVLQREQIERWARSNDATIGTIFEELDQSGARADRPMLAQLLARVEQGETNGVVVAAFDRFGRSLVDGLTAIERIQAADGTFVSIREGLDLRTDTGKLVLRIMFSMAEWELDRVRARWNAARRRAVERGVHMAPHPPAGYVRDPGLRLHPDPITGPLLTELFVRRAQGATVAELCAYLLANGVATPVGNPAWAPGVVHKLIKNRVYLGELHHGTINNRSAHLALIDEVTWNAAQNPRVIAEGARRRLPSVLAGIVRCAGCRMLMRSQTVTTRSGLRKRIYFCGRRFKAGECRSPAWISGAVLEPYVDATFFTLAANRRVAAPQAPSISRLLSAYERAKRDTVDYRDSAGIRSSLDEKRFSAGLAVRERRERAASLAITARRFRDQAGLDEAPEELQRRWPRLSSEQRRVTMSELIDCVFVTRRGDERARVFVCARGDGPVDLPRRGNRTLRLHPFASAATSRAEPAEDVPWPTRRIESELAEFLAGWDGSRWPTEEEFILAGRGPLLRQINQAGGPVRWAGASKLRPLKHAYWSDERIREALDVLLAARTTWPTTREFKTLGLGGLYTVLGRRGRRAWAEEYGLRYRNTGAAAPRWTEARVSAALLELCSGRDVYPSSSEFAAAGLAGLYVAIARRHGGHARWATVAGLPRHSWRNGTGKSARSPEEATEAAEKSERARIALRMPID